MGFFGDIFEGSIASVAVQDVVAVVREQQIWPAVIVIVSDADALRPASLLETGEGGDVPELAVSFVVIELREIFARRRGPVQARAVRYEYVIAPVAIIIEDSDAIAGGFKHI